MGDKISAQTCSSLNTVSGAFAVLGATGRYLFCHFQWAGKQRGPEHKESADNTERQAETNSARSPADVVSHCFLQGHSFSSSQAILMHTGNPPRHQPPNLLLAAPQEGTLLRALCSKIIIRRIEQKRDGADGDGICAKIKNWYAGRT